MRTDREHLRIVFKLDVIKGEGVEIGDRIFHEIKLGNAIRDDYVAREVTKILASLNKGMVVRWGGRRVSLLEFVKEIESGMEWGLPLEADGVSILFGAIPAHRQSFLIVEEKLAGAAGDWRNWVEPFLGEGRFVQGYVKDLNFDYWQNAKDPMQYELAGRDYHALPTIKNDLPPPLERMEIDISDNPGRWLFRSGYVEAVGREMWLSQMFWGGVGRERDDEAMAAAGWRLMPMPDGILKIEVPAEVFTEQGDPALQTRLRSAVYG